MTTPNPQPATDQTDILSEFADDADMIDLIEMFVADMHERIDKIQSAFTDSDTEELRTLAHQLKGSGGGYGFPSITEQAATVEQQIISADGNPETLAQSVKDLIDLCKRIKA